jgi:hypothetical protein
MVNGINIWLSKKHIQKYCNMFCFRMNTRTLDEHERISVLLTETENSRIMYKEVIAETQLWEKRESVKKIDQPI